MQLFFDGFIVGFVVMGVICLAIYNIRHTTSNKNIKTETALEDDLK